MRNRYYNPELKRFMNKDILEGELDNPTTLNRYSYVNGDPISYVDPFGLARESIRGSLTLENVHLGLDLLGFAPVVGFVPDLLNSVLYLSEGNVKEAIWSGVGAVPFVGDTTSALRISNKASKLSNKLKIEEVLKKEVVKNKPLYSPNIKKWYRKGGSITIDSKDGVWGYLDWEGNKVKYTGGFPDFKGAGFVKREFKVDGGFTTRSSDFSKANKEKQIGEGNTWHHHEDGETLQEVDTEIHKRYRHRGGISMLKKDK